MFETHSDGPFQVGSLLWRPRPGAFALTIVCKATFVLTPHKATLAAEQEPPNEDDDYWDDDASRSLHAPSDLVPWKPRVDVLLSGNACASGHVPVRSTLVRLRVGTIDKSIEVYGDRSFGPDGALREGAGFTRMPLRYERAAGGPGTTNPVGVRPFGADASGATPLPNLLPAGFVVRGPGDVIPPIGFGPVAPSWPDRQAKLGRGGPLGEDWALRPLPADFDPAFWNAAPADQLLEALHDDQRIQLEHVHPDHPRLRTALPGLRPRARVVRAGGTEEVELAADTLIIDADRGTCAVLWRGRVELASRAETGRIHVETASRRVVERFRGVVENPETVDGSTRAMTFPIAATALPDGALPFSPEAVEGSPRGLAFHAGSMAQSDGALPFSPAPPASARGVPDEAPRASYAPPPPPSPPPSRRLTPTEGLSAPPGYSPPPPSSVDPAPRSVRAPLPSTAAQVGVLEASNAAAARPTPNAEVSRTAGRSLGPARPSEALKVVWVDPGIGPHLGAARALARVMLESDLAPAEGVEEAMRVAPEGEAERTRRRAAAALGRGEPVGEAGVRAARADAVGVDGIFEPPLVLLAGELGFPFDELETLKATIAAVSPFTVTDRKLKETISAVTEIVQSGALEGAGALAAELGRQVAEAFAQAKRPVAADHVATHVERIVLHRRGYQKRSVFGEERIRALLVPRGAREAMPVYLPASLASELPMSASFAVRLLARVDGRQDPDEASPVALRVEALAIVVDPR